MKDDDDVSVTESESEYDGNEHYNLVPYVNVY